jgi:3-deoxy-D-manno-octulosonic-acid transferase
LPLKIIMLLLCVVQKLEREGHNVVLRSQHERFTPETNIYVVDTFGKNPFLSLT